MKQHIFSIKLELQMILLSIGDLPDTDACSNRCSCKKVFFKCTANLKGNTHAELGLWKSCSYFQNTFQQEHLWGNAAALLMTITFQRKFQTHLQRHFLLRPSRRIAMFCKRWGRNNIMKWSHDIYLTQMDIMENELTKQITKCKKAADF